MLLSLQSYNYYFVTQAVKKKIYPTPPQRAGYEKMSNFKQNRISSILQFSFSLTDCLSKEKKNSLQFTHNEIENG